MNPTNAASQQYDYTSSGIDGFLSRSIDQVTWQATLEANINFPGSGTLTSLPSNSGSNNLRLDANQVTGSLGNVFSSGSMTLDPNQDVLTLNNGIIQING